MNKFKYILCNKKFLSLIFVKKKYHHYHTKKAFSKKFLAENNINPDEVSEKLQGFTEIEKMLIIQVFPIILVYRF